MPECRTRGTFPVRWCDSRKSCPWYADDVTGYTRRPGLGCCVEGVKEKRCSRYSHRNSVLRARTHTHTHTHTASVLMFCFFSTKYTRLNFDEFIFNIVFTIVVSNDISDSGSCSNVCVKYTLETKSTTNEQIKQQNNNNLILVTIMLSGYF